MSVLTVKEVLDLNLAMLGKGAPVEIDGVGYNKVDFYKMNDMSRLNTLTDKQMLFISSVLMRYTNTQLTSLKDRIKETVNFYKEKKSPVTVIKCDSKGVELSWGFNSKISSFIKNSDKSQYRWAKDDNGAWVFKTNWKFIEVLSEEFIKEGFDVSDIEVAKSTIECSPEQTTQENKLENQPIEVGVIRPNETLDTLRMKTEYDKRVVDAMHSLTDASFNKYIGCWDFSIEDSSKLYKKLAESGISAPQLKPWADLVDSWNKNFDMIDLSNLNLKFKPYDFQIEDIKKLLELKVGLNGNDMGCGKTFESVVIGESIPMKKLVICPPTLRLNWKKEIQHVSPNANINILYSNEEFKVVDGWNIIGYNSLDKFLKKLESELFQVVFIDEAHYIQSINNSGIPESNRAFSTLRIASTANYVFPITGTPKTNRNKNMFNILRAIRHPLTKGNWAYLNYGKTYCDGVKNAWGWDFNGNSNDTELHEQLKPYMVRHLKKDVLPNLTKQRIMIPVEIDLKQYHSEIAEYLRTRTHNKAQDLVKLMGARKTLAIKKAQESINFANDLLLNGEQVVIVTCFTEVVKSLESAFKKQCVKLVGGMSDIEKDTAISKFQAGEAQVMIMNIIAGGVGVTLTKSHNMIINDFDWTPGNLIQAEDRICRSGQTECCNIHYLYADGAEMDEIFADTLTSKFDTINNAVDGGTGDTIDYYELINKALDK